MKDRQPIPPPVKRDGPKCPVCNAPLPLQWWLDTRGGRRIKYPTLDESVRIGDRPGFYGLPVHGAC